MGELFLQDEKLISKKFLHDKKKLESSFQVSWKEETYEEKILRELRSLTPAKALAVHGAIGYSADKLADELEGILLDKNEEKYSNAYVSRVFKTLMTAQTVYK